ncbi:MAG: tetratricopeptide repeat protein [Planctomycetaceae bacterium]
MQFKKVRYCTAGLACVLILPCLTTGQDVPPGFAGADSVVTQRGDLPAVRLTGEITEITGDTLAIRRSGTGRLQFVSTDDITDITFVRHADFDRALQLNSEGDYVQALKSLDRSLEEESRSWAVNEMQAAAVRICLRSGQYDDAVRRVELILKSDARSRHVSLLPLTWDERLPMEERPSGTIRDLSSPSAVRQLVAASVLLGGEHHPSAERILKKLREESGFRRLSDLAEAQLWRVPVLTQNPDALSVLRIWQDHVRQMAVEAQPGPRFTLGRCLLMQHDLDAAVLMFLWPPLMSADDSALAAASLAEAVHCLRNSGRPAEAEQMTAELKLRFPKCSAVRRIAEPPRP